MIQGNNPEKKGVCECGGLFKLEVVCCLWDEKVICDTCHNNHSTNDVCEGTKDMLVCPKCGAKVEAE